jgi:hypothetical protein
MALKGIRVNKQTIKQIIIIIQTWHRSKKVNKEDDLAKFQHFCFNKNG